MKILLDTCIWGGAADVLIQGDHDVIWTGDWPADPGDTEFLAFAFQEKRILVTLDKDFGELAIVRGQPHAGILRLVNLRAREQGPACVAILTRYGDELKSGAIITADATRVRIRPADSPADSN